MQPVEVWSKCGRRGRVKEPVGTHGKTLFLILRRERDLSLVCRIFLLIHVDFAQGQ